MKVASAICAAAVVAVLPGCASVQVHPGSAGQLKAGRSVAIGQDAVATVGEPMLSEFRYLSRMSAVTTAPFQREIALATVRIPAGLPLTEAMVSGKPAYCTPGPVVHYVLDAPRAACLFDESGKGVLDQLYVVGTVASAMFDVQVPYRTREVLVDPDGFKYELLYQGVERGDVLRISYREYKDSLARPAFQQDLVYTLDSPGPTQISFRGVRMLIRGADNNEVRYRVIAGFSRD